MTIRKPMVLLILLVFIGRGLTAGGLDWYLGGGWNSYFSPGDESPGSYPVGFAAFAGTGYQLLPEFSLGAEYEYGLIWSLEDTGTGESTGIGEQFPKLYMQFCPLEQLSLSALAGADIRIIQKNGIKGDALTAFALGMRIKFQFIYFQYIAIYFDQLLDSRLGMGIVFSR